MASLMYVKSKIRWGVRKHITDRLTGSVKRFDVLLPTRTQAAAAAAEYDRLAKAMKAGATSPDQICDAVTAWLNFMKSRTARTHDLYSRNIKKFIHAIPHHVCYINQVQPCHIYAFIAAISSEWTNATANRYLTAVKSFCRWSSRRYGIPNPAASVDMLPEPDPDSRFLSQTEFSSIIAAGSPSHKDLFQ